MERKQIRYLGCAALVVASGLAGVPSAHAATAHAATAHVVFPGESIQKAVDAAQAGDIIFIAPGTYHESVLVTKSGLSIRGSGKWTVLKPDATETDSCAAAGNGICVQGTSARPVTDTSIRSLTLTGYKKNGLWASNTDGLTVRRVSSEENGNWGFAEERSVRSVFEDNAARDNGESGLFLSNTVATEAGATDAHGTVARRNTLTGNRIGITVRRLQNVTVEDNYLAGNCAGVFVVGDENKPRTGAITVRGNRVQENNKYCPKTARLPFIQGAGIVLTGVENTVVEYNDVRDNVGTSPFSGGVVLYKSMVGTPNDRNVIRDNALTGNSTADLANRDTGKGNKFDHNTCRRSEPAGMC
ncbi:right-handed parallel beta-helix repeat-containing protein [Streptomyces sp. NPDC002088]|uniref:right-handed parallel beta-helix repeat-containing protein n=1 Tax=Streptomyces sp. NPDC002088 TaxID=3154665 RepID=UPI0033291F43